MNLGENIYHYRTQSNLSQGDLADSLEVSRQSVSKWENNSAVPELDKLMKMAQLFDITIDELVTGEDRTPTTAPAAPAQPAPAGQSSFPTRKLVGIILLCCGLLAFIVLFAVGIFIGTFLWSLAIGLPMILCGICCLVCKKHPALACGWTLYIPLWILITVFVATAFPGTTGHICAIGIWVLGLFLSAITLVMLWQSKITHSLAVKILLTALIVFILFIGAQCALLPAAQESSGNEPLGSETFPSAALPDG